MLALAHECGFDPDQQYANHLYPNPGETSELEVRLAQQLYIGVSAIVNQDTLPFATTWESDDGELHFRWVDEPHYAGERAPEEAQAGSSEGTEFSLRKAELQQLMDHLYNGPVLLRRATA